MTTFGATTTAPTTIPGMTLAIDCEEGQQECGGETEAPDDYDAMTGKPPNDLINVSSAVIDTCFVLYLGCCFFAALLPEQSQYRLI